MPNRPVLSDQSSVRTRAFRRRVWGPPFLYGLFAAIAVGVVFFAIRGEWIEAAEEVGKAVLLWGGFKIGREASRGYDLRALCAEAAEHLRTLPAQSDVKDGLMAQRLEEASRG